MEEQRESLVKERILEIATSLFLEYGYRKVTMDEIAEALKISKKTLYQFFPSKYDLINAVADRKMQSINDFIDKVIDSQEFNFIQKVHHIIQRVSVEHHQIKPMAFLDIQKSVPEVWKKIVDTQKQHIDIKFGRLLEMGREQGYIRSDVPSKVIATVYSTVVFNLLHSDVYHALNLTPAECFRYAVTIIYEGILTPKGLEEFKP